MSRALVAWNDRARAPYRTADMHFLTDLVMDAVFWLIGGLFFLTGELILALATLGRHRVRWYELQDRNITWAPSLLGAALWFGLGALLYALL